MDEEQVRQIVQEEIKSKAFDAQFNVVPIPAHSHNGVDSTQIDGSNITNGIPPRVLSLTTTGSATPNVGAIDLFDVMGATGAIAFNNPIGRVVNGQILKIRITSSNVATARSLTFSNSTGGYISNSPTLPSATTTGKTSDLAFQYDTNASLNKWRLIYSANS